MNIENLIKGLLLVLIMAGIYPLDATSSHLWVKPDGTILTSERNGAWVIIENPKMGKYAHRWHRPNGAVWIHTGQGWVVLKHAPKNNEKKVVQEQNEPTVGRTQFFRTYPNPNNGVFALDLINTMSVENIRIHSASTGMLVHQESNANTDMITINVSSYSSGVYILSFTINGTLYTEKIIIR